jgi:hypothetical protein
MASIAKLILMICAGHFALVLTLNAQTAQTKKGTDYQTENNDALLEQLFDTHQWFKLHDLIKKTNRPAFYQGAVAYAFNDSGQAEKNLAAAIDSASSPERVFDARTMLINLYMRNGRYRLALSETEKQLAIKPDHSGLKNAHALLRGLSQGPEMEISQRSASKINYTLKLGNLFVPVKVNGKEGNYLLDTGANFSLISEGEAKRMGLTLLPSQGHKIEGSAGAEVDFRIAIADRLSVGEYSFRNVPFLVVGDDQQPFVELLMGERGLLGLPLILAFRTIRWSQPGSFELGFAPGVRHSQISRLCFDGLQPVIEGEFQQKMINVFLDTGATRTRILPLFAKDFSSFLKEFGKKGSEKVTGVGGSIEVDSFNLPLVTLRIGGFDATLRYTPVLLKETTSDSRWWHVWVGMDLLNQARAVTIDFTSMMLLLE